MYADYPLDYCNILLTRAPTQVIHVRLPTSTRQLVFGELRDLITVVIREVRQDYLYLPHRVFLKKADVSMMSLCGIFSRIICTLQSKKHPDPPSLTLYLEIE